MLISNQSSAKSQRESRLYLSRSKLPATQTTPKIKPRTRKMKQSTRIHPPLTIIKERTKGSLCSFATLPPTLHSQHQFPQLPIYISQTTTTYPPSLTHHRRHDGISPHPNPHPHLPRPKMAFRTHQPKPHLSQRTPTPPPPPPPPPKPKWIPPVPPPPTTIQILGSLIKYLFIWSLILAYRYPSPPILVLGSTLRNTRYGAIMARYGGWEHWVVLYVAVYMCCRWVYDWRYNCCDKEIRRGEGRCPCRECRQWPREDACCGTCGYR